MKTKKKNKSDSKLFKEVKKGIEKESKDLSSEEDMTFVTKLLIEYKEIHNKFDKKGFYRF
ncbi:hypothetical protein [Spiroplasma tabanidicola]|uniref:hypothetical protein n=1 Tax=Spiroplasma tabanidicola TaxID=324079 RepID=UPI0012DFE0A3|nr:hypothetical protein [Spiroplasma tabanidicola]